ncbi:leucine rich repeat [Seminavis robusta]|uniref:Leucine rich repeat n=1 Tax=Seminavis robusta TaxID=568900 RepID=A0A9N8DTX1_9STRA|nr:leucine rich repeat [Seminavis robusta]|eukprot:Sro340_g121210.1 leucine rich repeat (1215) ;mRNA; f:26079-29872
MTTQVPSNPPIKGVTPPSDDRHALAPPRTTDGNRRPSTSSQQEQEIIQKQQLQQHSSLKYSTLAKKRGLHKKLAAAQPTAKQSFMELVMMSEEAASRDSGTTPKTATATTTIHLEATITGTTGISAASEKMPSKRGLRNSSGKTTTTRTSTTTMSINRSSGTQNPTTKGLHCGRMNIAGERLRNVQLLTQPISTIGAVAVPGTRIGATEGEEEIPVPTVQQQEEYGFHNNGNHDWFEDEEDARSNNRLLIEATLVKVDEADDYDEDPLLQPTLAEATPMNEAELSSNFFKSRHGRLLVGFVMLLFMGLVVVAVVVGIAATRGPGESTAPPSTSTLSPTELLESPTALQLLDDLDLPSTTVITIANHPESAPRLAFEWLLSDPFLPSLTDAKKVQRFALASLYFATQGSHWDENSGWLNHRENECSWYYSDSEPCFMEENIVTSVALPGNHLNGTIPQELMLLNSADFSYLDLSHNLLLRGSLPTQIGVATSLNYIALSSTNLSGSIPREIQHLHNLTSLDLSHNSFIGSIPFELGFLSYLSQLNLRSNRLTGNLPGEIFLSPVLAKLDLSGNQISGPMPIEMFLASGQGLINLSENLLNGSLPSELGFLTDLDSLDLHMNTLTGTLPTELGSMSRLHYLDLGSNSFRGSIPDQAADLCNLCHLDLSNNQITGSLPAGLGNLCHGMPDLDTNSSQTVVLHADFVDLSESGTSSLVGTLDRQVGSLFRTSFPNMSSFSTRYVDRAWNPIEFHYELHAVFLLGFEQGRNIPTQVQLIDTLLGHFSYSGQPASSNATSGELHLSSVTPNGNHLWLNMSHNKITGVIPTELLHPVLQLHNLDLQSNRITGSIPSIIGMSRALEWISLANNGLVGNIPTELTNITGLLHLDFSGNKLSGLVPRYLWKMPRLEELDLSNNSLNGSIALDAVPVQRLQSLRLGSNRFSGSLPTELGFFSSVCDMDVSGNMIVGTIPSTLGLLCHRFVDPLEGVSIRFGLEFHVSNWEIKLPSHDDTTAFLAQAKRFFTEELQAVFPYIEETNLIYIPAFSHQSDIDSIHEDVPDIINLDLVMNIKFSHASIPSQEECEEIMADANLEDFMASYLNVLQDACQNPLLCPWDLEYIQYDSTADPYDVLPPVYMDLSNNQLSGSIPSELARLSSSKSHLDLLGNRFSGALPEELCPWLCSGNHRSLNLYEDFNSQNVAGGLLKVDCQQIECSCSC